MAAVTRITAATCADHVTGGKIVRRRAAAHRRRQGGLAFAAEDTPDQLKDAFAALLESLGEVAGDDVDPALFTEVFWAALHGLATLTRAGRVPAGDLGRSVELLVDRLAVL